MALQIRGFYASELKHILDDDRAFGGQHYDSLRVNLGNLFVQ